MILSAKKPMHAVKPERAQARTGPVLQNTARVGFIVLNIQIVAVS